ncbi:hypothetical protein [Lentibacillus amyloliquefaciens]|uniref:hypothetical protein n=1 Tax=Lentibacillus amyloliquefaciens TaxID=1472767 RepID=UPI0012E35E6D|nr:hypothetical protein [Lentibacillus amyloliquefaciens]
MAGFIADQRPDINVLFVIGMMLLGMLGLVLISFHVPSLFLLGSFVTVIGLFGWNGLLVAAAIRLLSVSPVKILGWLQMGFFMGAALAPMVFGILMSTLGVRWAIIITAVCAVIGALMILYGEILRRATLNIS